MTPNELILWAINEIRDLDQACRSQIPAFESMNSQEVLNLRALEALAADLKEQETQDATGTP